MNTISLRDYAAKEGISLGTAYRRLWEGRVSATKCDGRWLISTSIDRIEEKREERITAPPPRKRKITSERITTPTSPILEEQTLNELGGPVKLPKHPLLETLAHARTLVGELGWPVLKSNVALVADAIVAESKWQGVTKAKAYDILLERVLADRRNGVSINGVYFHQAKWRHLTGLSKPK